MSYKHHRAWNEMLSVLEYYVNTYPYIVEGDQEAESLSKETRKNLNVCTCYGCIAYRHAEIAIKLAKELEE